VFEAPHDVFSAFWRLGVWCFGRVYGLGLSVHGYQFRTNC
jgi:hypothetical protein